MGTITLTDVTTGAPILASNLNTGWSALRTAINGGLDETNFTSGQVYSPSKIKQDGASTNDVLYWTGSVWDNSPLTTMGRGLVPVTYAKAAATVSVTNTASETNLVSQTITGGHMGTDRMLRLTVLGDINTSAIVANTFRLYLGATTLWGDSIAGATTAGVTYPWKFEVCIANIGSASSQVTHGLFSVTSQVVGSVAGTGNESATSYPFGGPMPESVRVFSNNSSAVNTASDANLVFSVQWGSASPSVTIKRNYWVLELI